MIEQTRWRALGTTVHLLVADGDVATARASVEQVLTEVDATYSRFRPDSELMAVNRAASGAATVSPLMTRALEVALRAASQTGGAVDPTVGRALRVIGYDDDFARVADRPARLHLLVGPVAGWRAVRLDPHRRSLHVPAGVELDLGSTGKALAADLAAEAAAAAAPGGGVLVSLGGDMSIAGRAPEGGWRILAAEDSETPTDSDGEVITLRAGAVATSSTQVRRWRSTSGEQLHHLIDPRTGASAISPWRTVSVVADTCVDANTASTATIVMGEAGLDWLAATGLPARLVGVDGEIVRIGGWPLPDRASGRLPADRNPTERGAPGDSGHEPDRSPRSAIGAGSSINPGAAR